MKTLNKLERYDHLVFHIFFSGNVKIKVATQDTKFNIFKNQSDPVNLKNFSKHFSYSASKLSSSKSSLLFLYVFL